MCNQKASWPFIDTPWDLLVICYSTLHKELFLTLGYTMGSLSAYILPLFTVFGILSNPHIIYIFLAKMQRKTRQLIYLSCLAAADTVNLILSSVLLMFPSKGLPFATNGGHSFFILSYGQLGCIGYRVVSTFSATLAINLLILASLDRCMAIYFPFKFIQMSIQKAWILVSVTCGITVIEVIPIAVTMKGYVMQPDGKHICTMASTNPTVKWVVQIYRQLFCNCGLVQVLLICVINLILLYKIIQTGTLRKQIQSIAKTSSKEVAAGRLILVMSLIFAVATIPQVVTLQIAFLLPATTDEDFLKLMYNINDISWIFFLVQESTNWIIYFLRMSNFRRHVLQSVGVSVKHILKEYTPSMVIDNNNKTSTVAIDTQL